jgi:hypothetical protein
VALAVLGLVVAGGLVWWSRPDGRRGVREELVGDAACERCHPGQAAQFSGSGHHRTLRLASRSATARRLDGRTAADPEFGGVSFSYQHGEDGFRIERRAGGEVERYVVDYVFGSGDHAATFLTMTDRDPRHPAGLEHRLTYYRAANKFAITPGQEADAKEGTISAVGRELNSTLLRRCFSCHSSITSAEGPDVLDTATLVPNLICERCHGPGRAHVEAVGRNDDDLRIDFAPGRRTALDQMKLCGRCHRYPGILPDIGVHQVNPSKVRPDNLEIVRFQPIGLMQSACYRKSRGRLSCTTCHDPHTRVSTDTGAYEKACLSCHQPPGQKPCPVSPASGCIGCHMPKFDAGQGIPFADHWIRPRRDVEAASTR